MTQRTADRAAEGQPSHIGRYRVVERIGKGTMGMVYAADDDTIGRRVAIKVMMGDVQDDAELRERFFREAKVTSQLGHRNIVTVFDFGEDHGHPFIVMELLKGLPLATYLRTAAPDLDAKISLMEQICEGLHVAHRRGVIHRDVKPSNLFVQDDGTLKILDFGAARPASSTLTLSGLMLGTPEYISPEQALGRAVDARSDLFAAAAVFYFILTGRGPFFSHDLPSVLRAVLHEDPTPMTEDEAPASLRRIVMKALAKAPADRYQDCDQVQKELEHLRRASAGTSHRVAQAALDRYRQIVSVIEERRALGHANGVSGIDVACDRDAAELAAQFAIFAQQGQAPIFSESLERAAADAALDALHARYNAEQAALAAMRAQAADVMRPVERRGADDLPPPATRGHLVAAAGLEARGVVSKKLIVDDGQRQRKMLLVGNMVIGRDPMCDVTDGNMLLSRRHAEFILDGDNVAVRDLGSRNGTFVNGRKVVEEPLRPGDLVQIGSLRVLYVEDDAPLPTEIAVEKSRPEFPRKV